ncbi:ribose-5-phosphate isomerase A, partial [Limosilactobacillus fermentum]
MSTINTELQNKLKKIAAVKAADYVKDDMIVGLGSGSTVTMLVDELGRQVQEEGLKFTGVSTSISTAKQAKSLGIKIVDLDSIDTIDLTIDGADQVDSDF